MAIAPRVQDMNVFALIDANVCCTLTTQMCLLLHWGAFNLTC
jgi:hypothetical protein